mgnify:CR=1 FL=1
MPKVNINVNGQDLSAEVEERQLLVHFLRDDMDLTGTHVGCDTSQCGACVVHLEGKAVKSCTMLAVQANGKNITTIEGIADGFVPTIYERHADEVDAIINVPGEAAIEMSQRLAAEKGLFVGPSSGANYWAALAIKKKHPELKTILTFMCDKAEKYLSLLYKL